MRKNQQLILTGLLLFVIDRVTKIISLRLPTEGVFYQGELIGFKLLLNKGIAFGLPIPTILSIVATLAIIFALVHLAYKKGAINNLHSKLGIGLVILGAISNLLDKIKYQAIIDFITIKFLPIFNLADLYIIIGAWLFIISLKKSIK